MEFEAVDEGTIISLAVAEGADGVKVGTVIALLAAEGEDTGAAPSKPAKAEKSEKAQATESKPAAPQPRPAPELAKSADASSIASEKASAAPAPKGDRVKASPLAKRLAEASGIDMNKVQGRSEEHTSELQSLMRTSYAVFATNTK